MTTKLDKLLERIDPSRTIDNVSADVDQAINNFSKPRSTIGDLDEYRQFLADFCRHVETTVLKMSGSFPKYSDFYWARCSNMLDDEFGHNGWKTAFEMVRTGKEGGLYRVLKAIADRMAENYAQNAISARIGDFLNNLTNDEQLAAADEYIEKHGHLIPSEFTSGNGARLKANFAKVLNEHPKIIQRIGRVGR